MPLVAHNRLPTFDRLRDEGQHVLLPDRARDQHIRPLHVGLLNMMPDAALAATERQFFRLVGSSNSISQFFVHPFSLDTIPRSDGARAYIDTYYESFAAIQAQGLDALIISGANVTQPDLAAEVFWEPLCEVLEWAETNVTSTLCSCLATHAAMLARYGETRRRLPAKCWGVFEHDVVLQHHPLVHDLSTRVHVPHSRFNDISRQQFDAHGLHVLAEGEEPGVQLVVSPDGFRTVFFQGHPEYDRISLLKEYKREVGLYAGDQGRGYPPSPSHYFDRHVESLLAEYRDRLDAARESGAALPEFPEALVLDYLHNTWHDSGLALMANWIGLVYQLTHVDRMLPYMDGVDRDDPLGWLGSRRSAGMS